MSKVNILDDIEVHGNVESNHIYAETYRTSRSDGDIYIQAATSSDFVSIGTEGGNNLLRVQGDGKVGIGAASPTHTLEVKGNTANTFAVRIDADYTSGQSYGLRVRGGTNSVDSALLIEDVSGNDLLNVKGSGTVGIGGTTESINWTDSPTLTVEGAAPVINLVDTDSSADDFNILNDNGKFRIFNDTDGRFDFNIDGSGNVSIGTSTPFTTGGTAKLTIASGVISFGASNSDMSYLRRTSTGNFQWQTYNNGNTGNIHLQPYGGNVGIGTTSPSAKLEVNGAVFVGNHTGTVTPTDGIWIEGASGTETQIQMYSLNGSVFHVKNAATKATIGYGSSQDRSVNFTNTGAGNINVGIGTDSPSSTLEVSGTTKIGNAAEGLSIDVDTTNVATIKGIDVDGNGWNSIHLKADGEDGLFIEKDTNRVGIGTTSPARKLAVAGAIELTVADTTLHTGHAAIRRGSGGEMFLDAPGHISVTIDTNNNNTDRYFNVRKDSGSELFRVQENGNVGIGTNSPTEKLEVNGRIKHSGVVTTEGTNIDQIKTFDTTLQLTADTWTDTGIDGSDLATGTYVLQVYVEDNAVGGYHYDEYYSGIISWHSGNTNSDVVDEITLHRAGHSPSTAHIQLRTERTWNADTHDLMLQIKSNRTHTAAMDGTNGNTITFKFRRLI